MTPKFDDSGLVLLLETFLTELRREYFLLRIAVEVDKNEKARPEFAKCRKFIQSAYFGRLSSLDGRFVLENLDREDPMRGYEKAIEDGRKLEAKRGYGKTV